MRAPCPASIPTRRHQEIPSGQAITMSTDDLSAHLADSGVTMRSDSEQYSPGNEVSSPSSSNSPVILYNPPTAWTLIRSAAINLVLPFINGMMLGFGELFAHEFAFRLGWGGTKVSYGLGTLIHKSPPLDSLISTSCIEKSTRLLRKLVFANLSGCISGLPSVSETSSCHWPRH